MREFLRIPLRLRITVGILVMGLWGPQGFPVDYPASFIWAKHSKLMAPQKPDGVLERVLEHTLQKDHLSPSVVIEERWVFDSKQKKIQSFARLSSGTDKSQDGARYESYDEFSVSQSGIWSRIWMTLRPQPGDVLSSAWRGVGFAETAPALTRTEKKVAVWGIGDSPVRLMFTADEFKFVAVQVSDQGAKSLGVVPRGFQVEADPQGGQIWVKHTGSDGVHRVKLKSIQGVKSPLPRPSLARQEWHVSLR